MECGVEGPWVRLGLVGGFPIGFTIGWARGVWSAFTWGIGSFSPTFLIAFCPAQTTGVAECLRAQWTLAPFRGVSSTASNAYILRCSAICELTGLSEHVST